MLAWGKYSVARVLTCLTPTSVPLQWIGWRTPSRGDADVTGDGVSFNQTVFDETRSYFKTPIINITQAASARVARIVTSNSTNPKFYLSSLGNNFDLGETGAYLIIFGDKVKAEAVSITKFVHCTILHLAIIRIPSRPY